VPPADFICPPPKSPRQQQRNQVLFQDLVPLNHHLSLSSVAIIQKAFEGRRGWGRHGGREIQGTFTHLLTIDLERLEHIYPYNLMGQLLIVIIIESLRAPW